MKQLLAFYYGRSSDDQGRYFAQILGHDDEWLEGTHNYIQWLFPLRERSGANASAPLIDAEIATAFRDDEQLRANMRAAFDRMLAFYGLCRNGDRIIKGANWNERKDNWFVDSTHNDLRITRILKSLQTLGLADEADQLFSTLKALRDSEPDCGIADEAFGYWQQARATVVDLPEILTREMASTVPSMNNSSLPKSGQDLPHQQLGEIMAKRQMEAMPSLPKTPEQIKRWKEACADPADYNANPESK